MAARRSVTNAGLTADAVAGGATNRLAASLATKGTLVLYGAMSGEAAVVNPGLIVFQDIMMRGFWLTRYLASAPRSDIIRLYGELEALLAHDHLVGKVDSMFEAENIKAAVARAGDAGAGGKVL